MSRSEPNALVPFGEVEAVQALYGREPRFLDPTLHHAPFAVDQLEFS